MGHSQALPQRNKGVGHHRRIAYLPTVMPRFEARERFPPLLITLDYNFEPDPDQRKYTCLENRRLASGDHTSIGFKWPDGIGSLTTESHGFYSTGIREAQ